MTEYILVFILWLSYSLYEHTDKSTEERERKRTTYGLIWLSSLVLSLVFCDWIGGIGLFTVLRFFELLFLALKPQH